MDILLGFFIGLLCGLAPLAFGMLTKHKIIGSIGAALTSASGILFAALEKSPFTSIGIAIVFIVFIFSKSKNKHSDDDDDNDIYSDDE